MPEAPIRFVAGLAPRAACLDEVPEGYRDYVAALRGSSAATTFSRPVQGADQASVDGTTYRQWGYLARELATRWDIRPDDRVLIDAAEHEHPLKWLLVPLSVGASVVLCSHLDPGVVESRVRAEQVTRVL